MQTPPSKKKCQNWSEWKKLGLSRKPSCVLRWLFCAFHSLFYNLTTKHLYDALLSQLAVFEELCKILFEIIIYSSGVYIICCVAGFVIKQCPYWLNNNVINVSLRNHVISLYFTNRLHFPYCFKVYKLPPHHTQPPVLIKLVY